MILAISMAIIAYTLLALGFILQKKGINWMGWKGTKDKEFFKNFFTWLTGFIIMNIYALPSAIALKTLPSHLVSAFAGWGIIMLVGFSYLLLKEKIFSSDYLFSGLIVVGIVMLNIFEKNGNEASIPGDGVWGKVILFALPLLLMVIGLMKFLDARIKTRIFAAVSGMLAGIMVVTLRLLVVQFGYQVTAYLGSLYLYLYLVFALLSFISLQLALKNGPLIVAGPMQYSTNIIYPVCAALLVFGQTIAFEQYLAVAMIVFGVISILKKH